MTGAAITLPQPSSSTAEEDASAPVEICRVVTQNNVELDVGGKFKIE